jgi:pimeloyl-ACP methyl ester carboxylesterase
VLLIPGFGTDVSAFAPQIPQLTEKHHVLAMNPRGLGVSDAPESERSTSPPPRPTQRGSSVKRPPVVGASGVRQPRSSWLQRRSRGSLT